MTFMEFEPEGQLDLFEIETKIAGLLVGIMQQAAKAKSSSLAAWDIIDILRAVRMDLMGEPNTQIGGINAPVWTGEDLKLYSQLRTYFTQK